MSCEVAPKEDVLSVALRQEGPQLRILDSKKSLLFKCALSYFKQSRPLDAFACATIGLCFSTEQVMHWFFKFVQLRQDAALGCGFHSQAIRDAKFVYHRVESLSQAPSQNITAATASRAIELHLPKLEIRFGEISTKFNRTFETLARKREQTFTFISRGSLLHHYSSIDGLLFLRADDVVHSD